LADDERERRKRKLAADAGCLTQHLLRARRESIDAARREIDDVVRHALRAGALEIPAPRARHTVERDAPFVREEFQELPNEEGVASGLTHDELGEGLARLGALKQTVAEQELNVALRERLELEADDALRALEPIEQGLDRVSDLHFGLAVSNHEHHVVEAIGGDELF